MRATYNKFKMSLAAAMLAAGNDVSTPTNSPRWGGIGTPENTPNKRTKINRAHKMKALTKLNSKRKAKKIAKRARK